MKDFVDAEPVEPLDLKGKAEPVPAYLLTYVSGLEHGEAIARRLGRADGRARG